MEQITIKEIAKICGVGVSTVSRAINNHPDINPETKKKILDTITEYQYIPNNSARNLKRSESNTIAVLAKGISNPLFGAMVQMLERDILGKQYLFVLQQVDEEENEIEAAIRLEKEKRLKGIIFLGGASHPREDLLHQLTVPYVICTVNAVLGESLDNFGVVSIDDEAESYRMVDYLCRMGHRRIAILTSLARDSSIGTLRLEGYKRALRDNGIEYDESLVVTMDPDEQTYTMQNGYQQTKQLLSRGVPFTAVYAIADVIAIGACKAIFDAGLKVPEDVSVAGFDGLDQAYYYQPSLTTIEQPIREMTTEASRILFELINEKTGEKVSHIPGETAGGTIGKKTNRMKSSDRRSIIEGHDLTYEYLHYDDDGNVDASYKALKGVSLDVKEGQFIAILGHNGSGKSTLARQLNALLVPSGGTLFVDGLDTREEKNVGAIRQAAGMVFQNPDNQIIASVVEEDVGFGPENMGIPTREIWERVRKALKTVGMWEYRESSPNRLSGGQKQRVAIAGVIAMKPKCIVLDEPTAMLDPGGRAEVIRTVQELNRTEGITVILITHYMEEVIHADRVLVMDEGTVVMSGTPREVFSNVRALKEIRLDVPFVTELADRLKERGVPLPDGILTVEELTEELEKIRHGDQNRAS